MAYKYGLVLACALAAMVPAQADTIYLKNGVRFDGVATPVPDQEGIFKVSAGDRQLIYRDSEIDRIEKNQRTGHLDKQALVARWEERNKKLTEETGLTADQRRLVRGLVFELKSEDGSVFISVKDKLQALQSEFDVYGYLLTIYPELSPLLSPNVLRVMAYLDPARSVPLLQEGAEKNYFPVRVISIEMLGRLRHQDSVPILARGLVDFSYPVQISAAYALASMGVRQATPALISLLTSADLRVTNASRESLNVLWAEQLGDKKPISVTEWTEFYSAQTNPGAPIQLAELAPLSSEEDEIKQTIDSNH
tara:strand:+ start:410 stop:1333 length:924 start_codon:yes stop_codon:yes gene_type:complete